MALEEFRVILLLVYAISVSKGSLPHTTCKRTYDKIGGFNELDSQRALPTMLLTDRDANSDLNDGHVIKWDEWSESVHSLACRCAAKARKNGWKVFGLQFFGECWSGPNAHNDYKIHGKGSPTYQLLDKPVKPCNKTLDHECVGGADVNYVYRLQDLNIDGGYSKWSNWSSCSKSCGVGVRSRDRTCTNPKPSGNGKGCQHLGPSSEKAACNTQICPTSSVNIDGGWSAWQPWSKCSVTCGGGTQTRIRTCTNPKPQGTGKSCLADAQESRACLEYPCPPPCNNAMDVGIILDGSGSVKQENFNKVLKFLANLVSYYKVSPAGTRFGLITYSTNPTMEFTMADKRYHHLTSLKQRLQSVKYPDGLTYTDRALLLAGLALFTPYGGDRSSKPNALVVFTDGKTSDGSSPYPEALRPLQAKAVRTIAVGIGPEVDHDELLSIAMGDPNYVIHATSFDTLKYKLDSIRDDSCKVNAPPPPTPECHRYDPLGMSSGGIMAHSITASSQLNNHSGPELARLHMKQVGKSAGAWSAKYNNKEQWLQVHFENAVKIIRFATQGRKKTNDFVKSYWLSYGQDGEYFRPYAYKDKLVIFKGNKDGSSVAVNNLPKPIYTRYLRLHPKFWSGRISLRAEFYGCKSGFSVPPVNLCQKRLGMETGDILDSHISASSQYSKESGPSNGRLYLNPTNGNVGAWRAKTDDLHQWLEVDLGPITKVNIIATQGRQDKDQWVESYSLSFSSDAVFWEHYRQRDRTTIFSGNSNKYAVIYQSLKPPIYARHVRIHPKTWHGAIAMRIELYGCRYGFDLPPGPKCIEPLGMTTGSIPNAHIRATSSTPQSEPFFSRLRLPAGAWSPQTSDLGQWLQINIGKISKVTRIATQGSFSVDKWVKSYTIDYSLDGGHFDAYSRTFEGNSDRRSISGHILYPNIYAKYVRIRPKTWHGGVALRLELYGCKQGFTAPIPESCMKSLGIEDGQTSDSQLSASSHLSSSTVASQGRLHQHPKSGKAGGWVAKTTKNQWFGVDFYDDVKVTRMSIQGRQDADQWVTSFILKYSSDGYMYETYKIKGKEKLFHGNEDRYTVVSHVLKPPIVARYFRIFPKTWHNSIALRVDFYGCKSDFVRPPTTQCTKPVGIETREILDSALTASSSWNSASTGPQWGRLNLVSHGGAWVARNNDDKQWIQVDLGGLSKVTRCATQGRQNADAWVTRYKVQHSKDGKTFVTYQNFGVDKVFVGNSDRSTVAVNVFDPPIEKARYIRVVPQNWHNHIALRLELFGCKGAPVIPTSGQSCSFLDLGIAIDCSGGVRLQDFQKVQPFLRRLVDKLQLSINGNRMGMICYNDHTMPMVNFADTGSQNTNRMKTMISHIPYLYGGTRTDKALALADSYFFSNAGGDRLNKPNVLLVLTDGKKNPSTAPYPIVLAPLLHKKVKVIAIGIGKQPDSSQLLSITGQHKDRVLHISNYNKLYSLLGNAAQGSCTPPTIPPPPSRCQHGWIEYKSNCYFFDHTASSSGWYDARGRCYRLAHGGHVVDIRDSSEWAFVTSHLQRGKHYYIGMRDEPLETWWMWQDGTLARFFKWASGQPNGGARENCAVMSYNGFYSDSSCYVLHSNYICKAKAPSP